MFVDFEYSGKQLSDFGCVVCSITSSVGVSTVNIGSQLNFNTIAVNKSTKFKLMSTEYTEAYTTSFHICKSSCSANKPIDKYFTDIEVRSLMKWLNRKQYFKFKPIYEDTQYPMIYYMGSFNVQLITIGSYVIELTLQTNSPFAHYEPLNYSFTVNTNGSFVIHDVSDEIGYIYPDIVKITCLSSGKLSISNSKDSRSVVVYNCVSGEIITLIGESKIIESSKSHSTLYNDFNYNFLKIHNDYDDGENVFTVSIPCTIDITYSPICKVGVV